MNSGLILKSVIQVASLLNLESQPKNPEFRINPEICHPSGQLIEPRKSA